MGKSGETFDEAQLQRLSDDTNGTTKSDIKLKPSTTMRISTLFNFKRFGIAESSEDDFDNEIEKSDVIEIEVPVIGSEFLRRNYEDNELKVDDDDSLEKFGETMTTTTSSDIFVDETSSDDGLTFSNDFQASPSHTTTYKNALETTTQANDAETSETTTKSEEIDSHTADDIQSVESKLMEQRKATDNMIDSSLEREVFTTVKPRIRPKFPFNVKIIVNNEEERKSCKSKTSCSQVSFAGTKQRDIDPQFYVDYDDEDLFFQSEPDRYYQQTNELRPRNARRADDEMVTPAPRIPPFTQGRAFRKPAFIERLENESSLERSERVNKNLDNLMRFISVWAQVDKFVSDRARGAVKKIAYLAGDDYDEPFLGSKRRVDRAEHPRDPFT